VFSDMNAVAVAHVNAGPTAANAGVGVVTPMPVDTVVTTINNPRTARRTTAPRRFRIGDGRLFTGCYARRRRRTTSGVVTNATPDDCSALHKPSPRPLGWLRPVLGVEDNSPDSHVSPTNAAMTAKAYS
jgi:hypothetical protein